MVYYRWFNIKQYSVDFVLKHLFIDIEIMLKVCHFVISMSGNYIDHHEHV